MTSKSLSRNVPGDPVLRNLHDNTGDAGLIPGQGTKIPHALGQLSPYTATRESLCTTSNESVLPKENPYRATGESLCTTVKIQYRQNKI